MILSIIQFIGLAFLFLLVYTLFLLPCLSYEQKDKCFPVLNPISFPIREKHGNPIYFPRRKKKKKTGLTPPKKKKKNGLSRNI